VAPNNFAPAWSPNGKQIAFNSRRDGVFQIYVMNADGSDQTRLTTDGTADFIPTWSPNGTHIAFMQLLGETDFEIFAMHADGTGQVNLTEHPAVDRFPDWGRGAGLLP
jgi:Tol biopolymer transport system component